AVTSRMNGRGRGASVLVPPKPQDPSGPQTTGLEAPLTCSATEPPTVARYSTFTSRMGLVFDPPPRRDLRRLGIPLRSTGVGCPSRSAIVDVTVPLNPWASSEREAASEIVVPLRPSALSGRLGAGSSGSTSPSRGPAHRVASREGCAVLSATVT